MAKQLIFRDEARHRLKAGMDKMAQAVAATLGPKGRNIALDQKWGAPLITHDGVTVAKEIAWSDPFEVSLSNCPYYSENINYDINPRRCY